MINQLPAKTGSLWVKQGYQYFKKQPMEFSTLFFGYLFSMLILSLIPYLGQLLAFIFLPLFTLSFMQACKEIDKGARARAGLLLVGFRSPQVLKLLQLGVLYFIAALIAIGASTLVDDGVFWQVISGQLALNSKNVEDTNMTGAMLFSMLVYLPALMGFWFAGPLIAWQKMSVFKAIFYSFFATTQAASAFLLYGLTWFTLSVLLPTIFSVIIAALTGNSNLILLIMMPVSMVLTIILYCSFYPTYKAVFQPEPTIS
ncbi:MAG: hypothetical protein K0R08_1973 [Solimicrobium sp.]|jgi:hypothetical protein|nr:hypothetical protein [Solimicrobium sp.]